MTELERELAALIVSSLELDGIKPGDIDREAPLFREGLGLDSIDALEVALAVSKHYGVQLKANDERDRQAFTSLHALASYITERRSAVSEPGSVHSDNDSRE